MDHTKVDLTPGEIVGLIERLNVAEDRRSLKSSRDAGSGCDFDSETKAEV